MRFVGQTEVYALLAKSPEYGDALRAWTSEVKYRKWNSAEALAADFQHVDISRVPVVIFYLAPEPLRVETLINFRLGIVLVTTIKSLSTMSDRFLQTWNPRHGH